MAESSLVSQEDAVSPFFLSSSSIDVDRRLFEHDSSRHISDTACRYYLQGTCFFGPNCKYDHIMINNENKPKFNSQDGHSTGPSQRSAYREDNTYIDRGGTDRNNSQQSRFTILNRNAPNSERSDTSTPGPVFTNWINAPEFVPKQPRSYADTVKANILMKEPEIRNCKELCPLHIFGLCPNTSEDDCQLVHGDMCELCHKACLHPHDEEQRKFHTDLCEKELEQEIEFSFAVQRSLDKTCSICMELILEKEPLSERRFGILNKCNHVFCLSCIRKWRRSKQCETDQNIDNGIYPVVTRTCPVCRTASDFITPSAYFVDTDEEKKKLITEYKQALSNKPCKYFKQGEGTCPFGGSCFYLHAKPDGTKVNLPIPTRRRRKNQDGELNYMGEIYLWDFLEYREENILINVDFTDRFVISDSDNDSFLSHPSDESF